MTPYQGLLFFGILILLLLPAAFFGLCGKGLRVLGAALTALMLLAAFDSPKALITLAVFWLWQSGLCFGYLAVRKRWQKRWMLWLFVLFSLVPMMLVKLSALVPPLRRAHQRTEFSGFRLFSALFPVRLVRTHRPLPPLCGRPARRTKPGGLPRHAAGGRVEADDGRAV